MIKRLPLSTLFRTLIVSLLLCLFLFSKTASASQPAATTQPEAAFLTGPNEGEPLAIALDYVKTHREELGLTAVDLANVLLTDHYTSQHNGTTHIYLQQQLDGIRVYNAFININIAADGSVINLGSGFVRNLAQTINRTTPILPPEAALVAALQALDLSPTEPIQVLRRTEDGTQRVVLGDAGIARRPITAQLVYQPLDGEVRLAWELEIDEAAAENWWSLRIDAVNGKLLDRFNYVIHEDFKAQAVAAQGQLPPATVPAVADGQPLAPTSGDQYQVYAMPDESPLHGSTSRVTLTDPADPTASPFAWHDTNGAAGAESTRTQGNNVNAYEDGDANNTGTAVDCGTSIHCNFAINLTQHPNNYEPAAVANLFYWNNIIHDLWYQYGFDEPGGNFQENNYGKGGAASDSVNAEAQDGGGTCNANFSTPVDGGNPRMQMYLCGNASPVRDGDLDNGVIVHEYGHGISIRLTGGPSTSSCLTNDEQGGEGWSDWFGMMMTTEVGDQAEDSRGMGTYLFGQAPNGAGIRPQPYTTNMAINSFTYGDVSSQVVPHGVGWGWATILWDVNWALIDQYGFDPDFYSGSGGNNIAMQLIIDGLKLQPCNPTFINARDAILLADQNNSAGTNQCLLWQAFARRGLGASASSGGSGLGGEVEAFDLPVACLSLTIAKTATPNPVTAGNALDYTLAVQNESANGRSNVTITDDIPVNTTYLPGSATCGGSHANGTVTFNLGSMSSGATQSCSFSVTVSSAIGSTYYFTDDMENGSSSWVATAGTGSNNWALGTAGAKSPTHAWFANDVSTVTDQYLTLANAITLPNDAILSFWHDYNTESTYDGGVIEISVNNGSWQDLGPYITQNGYTATISSSYSNPIGGRQAFTGDSNGYINTHVNLNTFSGSAVKIRFRLATDSSISDEGWYLDDVAILTPGENVTNTACVTSSEGDNECATITTEVLATSCVAPDPVQGVTITHPSSNVVRLDWTAVGNANQYEVWYTADTPYFNPTGGNCSSPSPYACALESNNYFEHTLTNNIEHYYYLIIASNSCGATASTLSTRTGSFEYGISPGQ